jgi:hypothetical protein
MRWYRLIHRRALIHQGIDFIRALTGVRSPQMKCLQIRTWWQQRFARQQFQAHGLQLIATETAANPQVTSMYPFIYGTDKKR